MEAILAADCGSTTTKLILVEKRDDRFRLSARAESPTTVEAPFEDVTVGLLTAVRQLEEATGRRLLDQDGIIRPCRGKTGVDAFVSTSSAGGGLQMMVAGVVHSMTAESAARAALGAGAIVVDVLSSDDPSPPHVKVERLRSLRPDMVLLSGGVDGGTVEHVVELAEIIAAASPKPRLGADFRLPVVFAGNRDAREHVEKILSERTRLTSVPNIRPRIETENLEPTREKIHELFMEHVMARAPGYRELASWTDAPVAPTPAAVGDIVRLAARQSGRNVVAVDIGGATTDVFSVVGGVFNRTVSANLGLSYSASNVLAEAGVESVRRWLATGAEAGDFFNMVANKVVRPTTIPETVADLQAEHALAREALRLSFGQHCAFAKGLSGVQLSRTIADAFDQKEGGRPLIDMMAVDLIIGSGGVLSHAPRRVQAAMMIVDAFLPEGVTELAVDSVFMMPHLGVMARIDQKAAVEVFFADCLVPLGTCIAPVGRAEDGEECVKVELFFEDGKRVMEKASFGEMKVVPASRAGKLKARVIPSKAFDAGEGRGRAIEREVSGGEVGIILDARGRRPFILPEDARARIEKLAAWSRAAALYPSEEV